MKNLGVPTKELFLLTRPIIKNGHFGYNVNIFFEKIIFDIDALKITLFIQLKQKNKVTVS